MTYRFADWAWSTESPDARQLYTLGFRAVGRYIGLGSASKHLTPGEITYLHSAGLGIVALAEGSADAPFVGDSLNTGRNHARQAISHARTLGFPPGCIIVYAYDRDTVAGNIGKAVAYGQGAYEVSHTSEYGAGAYGDVDILGELRRRGYASLFFKAAADGWDHGLPTPAYVHLDQQRNGQAVAGGIIDIGTMQETTPGIWYPGDNMSADAENQIKQVYEAIFNGGPSCGAKVPTVSTSRYKGEPSNALIAKLDYIIARLDTTTGGSTVPFHQHAVGASVTGTMITPDKPVTDA